MSDIFKTHLLNNLGQDKAKQIAVKFDGLLEELTAMCPAGRELSLVQTKLEEACFFAKKSIARQSENQQ